MYSSGTSCMATMSPVITVRAGMGLMATTTWPVCTLVGVRPVLPEPITKYRAAVATNATTKGSTTVRNILLRYMSFPPELASRLG